MDDQCRSGLKLLQLLQGIVVVGGVGRRVAIRHGLRQVSMLAVCVG